MTAKAEQQAQPLKNIRQRISAVMQEVEYVKRESAGQGTGVKYDDVVAKLRPSMIKNGINLEVSELGKIEKVDELIAKSGSKQSLYQGQIEVRLVNIDDPKDFVPYIVTAHGADNGDKAPGKLNTYATKVALVKAFMLETGENDESRNYKEPEVVYATPQQVSAFYDLLAATSSEENSVLNHACMNVLKYGQVYTFAQLPEQAANIVIGLLNEKLKRMNKEAGVQNAAE